MILKKNLRLIIRKMLCVKEKETISDAINRKKLNLLSKFNKIEITISDVKKAFRSIGICKGDIVIMHSSWKSLIGFKGKPEDIIECILDIIGENGTLIMPCFSVCNDEFNYNDESNAGIITEIYRKRQGVIRSLDSVFSMCGSGKYAEDILNDSINSYYCFDEHSPYSRAISKNAKVLLIGLGKNPHKITLFHCVTYALKDKVECYKNVYTNKKNITIVDKDGNKISKKIVERQHKYQNNKKKFRKLFRRSKKLVNYCRVNKTDLYLFDSKEMYDFSFNYIINNNYNLYKR